MDIYTRNRNSCFYWNKNDIKCGWANPIILK